jgi:type IV pilus assembly protein PilV
MKQLTQKKCMLNFKKPSRGFTLLEILVAIIVLSFGLLGMVGIQAMALKSNNDAKQQSTAVQLAGELSDMMRSNKAIAVGLTPAANPYLVANYFGGSNTVSNPPEMCTGTYGCTSTINVARWEMYDWLTRVNDTLPGARVQVCYDNAPYTTSALGGLPQWGCSGTPAAGGSISIKIGWIRESTNKTRAQTGNAAADASTNAATAFIDTTDAEFRPSVIYVVTPGSTT